MGKADVRSSNNEKKKISSLDVFLFILLIMCIAGVAVRLAVGENGILPAAAPDQTEFAVSFELRQAKTSLSGFFSSGEVFYDEGSDVFGTVDGQVSVTPAQLFTEDEDGKYVISYSGAENGDNSLVDIRGTMTVKGYKTDYGFLVNGETYIAPNFVISLHSDKTTSDVRIMDITEIRS